MGKRKKSVRLLALSLAAVFTLTAVSPQILPVGDNISTVQAAAVKLNATKVTLIKGQTKALKVVGTGKKATWSSNKKSVATVNKSGKITAKAKGTATITAKVNNKKYTCKVTVETPKISKTTLNLTAKQTALLKMTGTKQKVKWSSTKSAVAKVASNGKVTAITKGTANIVASVGGKKYVCKVNVKIAAPTPASTPKPTPAPKEKPNFMAYTVPLDEYETYVIPIFIKNFGSKPLIVLKEGYLSNEPYKYLYAFPYLFDLYDNPSYRLLTNQTIPARSEGTACYREIDQSDTMWLDNESTFLFYFMYDGVKYGALATYDGSYACLTEEELSKLN